MTFIRLPPFQDDCHFAFQSIGENGVFNMVIIPSWNIERTVGYNISQTWRELSQAEEAPETNE